MAGDPFGLSGQVIEAQFRVDHPIGEGGFSVVYKGLHLGLDEWVAIKCLKLSSSLESDMIESFAKRFRDESRIAYRLSQGNLDIVRSITAGTTVGPITGALVPYMVLEWLDGVSLAREFYERRQRGLKGRTIDEVIELFEPAVNAVAYAHAQGVVHRDLKPGNLFLATTRAGVRLKVLDFGLAKIVGDSIGIVPSVQTVGQQTIVCSPSYGAPEQFDPRTGKIGPWTDVYALGLLVLEALRDAKVRTGDGLAQCALQALTPTFPMTCHALGIKVRPQVELALARAVAIDIATRPADAAQFWEALKRAATRSGPKSTPNPPADAVPTDAATMWDPRGAAMADTAAPSTQSIPNAPARDPFMGTAMMLEAPSRPKASTAPLVAPPPNVIIAPPPPSQRAGSQAPAPSSQQSPFASSLAAPQGAQVIAPSYPQQQQQRPSYPQQAAQPPYAQPQHSAPYAQPQPYAQPMNAAPMHAPAPMNPPAPLYAPPQQPYSQPPAYSSPPAPIVPKSRAPLVILFAVVGLVVLGGAAVALYWFLARAH